MSDVKKYVDKLFQEQAPSEQINDLKMEIVSNLEARIEDNIARGMDEKAAFSEATANLKNIDGLIDHRRKVLRYPYFKELLQVALIYLLIAFIIVTPLSLSMMLIYMSKAILGGIIIAVVLYAVNYGTRMDTATISVDMARFKMAKRWIWLLWGLFIVVKTLLNIGVRFGSAIWFGRGIHIDGPYQFLMLMLSFVLPGLTIIIPLMVTRAYKIVRKHEVNQDE